MRKTLTTGYTENISHSGKDGTKAYEFKLKCLALLADTTVNDLKEHIDFWMSDRAGDCNTLLQNLGVSEEKAIKCCAHLILGVDHACDKVFRNTEQHIGIQNLIKITAGEKVFCSPSSSIHTLGLIAIAKLLSPSHAAHSVSLYNEYIAWMSANDIPHTGFKGFVANRFGRIAGLAKEYLARHWRQKMYPSGDGLGVIYTTSHTAWKRTDFRQDNSSQHIASSTTTNLDLSKMTFGPEVSGGRHCGISSCEYLPPKKVYIDYLQQEDAPI
ncbi:Cullin-2 [Mactra antiquata]